MPRTQTATAPTATVTRIYRIATKIGEDYVTLESTVTLPPTASDDDVQAAVDLGSRIYDAQRAALDEQVATMHEDRTIQNAESSFGGKFRMKDPDAAATAKQRGMIDHVVRQRGGDDTWLFALADVAGFDMLNLTKGQASLLIDIIKAAPAPRHMGEYHEPASVVIDESQLPEAGPDDIPF